MIKYSLIIPCYNEAKSLDNLICNCKKNIRKDTEIIFVNNGSKDESLKIFKKLIPKQNNNIKYINVNTNIGYGDGILNGLKKSKGKFVGWTHADLQTNPVDAIKNFKLFEDQLSEKIFIKGKRIKRNFFDNIFSLGMSVFESVLFQKIFYEINAQPNLFSRSFYTTWINPPKDFSLDLYVYVQAKKQKLKIKRFNVFFDKRRFGESKWNTDLKSKLNFILRTLKFSFKLRFTDDKN